MAATNVSMAIFYVLLLSLHAACAINTNVPEMAVLAMAWQACSNERHDSNLLLAG